MYMTIVRRLAVGFVAGAAAVSAFALPAGAASADPWDELPSSEQIEQEAIARGEGCVDGSGVKQPIGTTRTATLSQGWLVTQRCGAGSLGGIDWIDNPSSVRPA
ncbi:hypothetical protein DP939_40490 [Spongiactinospora rosea]|uniref:Secreted protein n=1 Tax=Spongiactinospora rosea TaxID=2248750 RepID=A0A366LLJ6_9ACTN|nr:hypothetical protein [Spongiactinospora rosea]RBQ14540.1 hypothetical protein DP939_40490 [Spongiactinospora rosea]